MGYSTPASRENKKNLGAILNKKISLLTLGEYAYLRKKHENMAYLS
jgi:hypothetical protein